MKTGKKAAAFVLAAVMVFCSAASGFALNRWQYESPSGKGPVSVIIVLEEKDFSRLVKSSGKTTQQLAEAQLGSMYRQLDAKGISAEVGYEYTNTIIGFSATVDYDDIAAIEKLQGVAGVYPVRTYTIPENEVQMEGSNEMTGADYVRDTLGLSGSGIVVAVVDSGFYTSHAALQVYDGMLEKKAMTKEAAEEYIAALGHGHYVSDKIPFAYNYSAMNEDITDTIGHGSHVSGIIAGYVPEDNEEGYKAFSGVAPDAQILAMKVCPDNTNAVDEAAVLKALDDAKRLGADVVNLSLGEPNGFSFNPEKVTDLLGDVYEKLNAAGVAVCCAAGNESNNAEGASNFAAQNGFEYLTADYSDYGRIAEPSSYTGNIAVASVNNISAEAKKLQVLSGGGVVVENLAYDITQQAPVPTEIYGSDHALEFVYCGMALSEADVEGKDLTEKIAFVRRGITSFAEKWAIVSSAGAIGLVVFDNQNGILSADGSIPFPFYMMTKVNGEKLLNYFDDETSTAAVRFRFTDEAFSIRPEDGNTEGRKMSLFSSWGPVPNLELKPNISGVGGSIKSISTSADDAYVLLSGTSMATPDLAGAMAVLISYLRDIHPELDCTTAAARTYISDLAEELLESSADLIYQNTESMIPASPRQQGAGLLNLKKAIEIASEGSIYFENPLSSLGDDADGEFYWTVSIAGIESTENLVLEPLVLVDKLELGEFFDPVKSQEEYEATGVLTQAATAHLYNTLTQEVLSPSVYEFISTIGAVNDGKAVAECSLRLDPSLFDTYNDVFSCAGITFCGMFVDGFVSLKNPGSEGEIVHNSFLGYAGDWTAATIAERLSHVDDQNAYVKALEFVNEWNSSMAAIGNTSACIELNEHMITEVNTSFNYFVAYDFDTDTGIYMGIDPFVLNLLEEQGQSIHITDDWLAFSNEGSKGIFAGLYTLRNAKHLYVLVTDAETGTLYDAFSNDYNRKSYYDYDYGWVPDFVSYIGTDMAGNKLPSGTKLNISYYMNVAYGDDELGDFVRLNGITDLANNQELKEKYLEYSFNCYVDGVAPVVAAEYDAQTGNINYNASDDNILTSVRLEKASGDYIVRPIYASASSGAFSGLENGTYKVIGRDAAQNESAVTVTVAAPGEPDPIYDPEPYYPSYTPSEPRKPEKPQEELQTMTFTDVKESDWFFADVNYVWENKLFNGVSETLFDPNREMTRAMLVTVLYRMAGNPEVNGVIPFSDVSLDMYYAKAIVWAYKNGITKGYDNGLFGVDDSVTREDSAVFLMRFAKYMNRDVQEVAELSKYTDKDQISSYALDAMAWARAEEIINGKSENTCNPKDTATRAEIAAIVRRYYE